MKNEMTKNTLIITVIALVCGVLLGLVHEVTAGPIAAEKQRALEAAYMAVMAEAVSFEEAPDYTAESARQILDQSSDANNDYTNDSIDALMIAKDGSGNVLGYVMDVTAGGGYGGNIKFSMGVDPQGNIQGISITEIAETPGLGMRAQSDPAFLAQFIEMGDDNFTLGTEVQGLTSATITSRCVTKGINAGLAYGKGAGLFEQQ
ncbi:MAG: FMN-binding protein [Lachnospiraceae bacterium]|nr:FMN-binding protein [Lachnospiraceae bacterium]